MRFVNFFLLDCQEIDDDRSKLGCGWAGVTLLLTQKRNFQEKFLGGKGLMMQLTLNSMELLGRV